MQNFQGTFETRKQSCSICMTAPLKNCCLHLFVIVGKALRAITSLVAIVVTFAIFSLENGFTYISKKYYIKDELN